MKKFYLLFSIGLTIVILVASRSSSTFSSEPVPEDDCCNKSVYSIYPEALQVWNASWRNVHPLQAGNGVRVLTANDLNNMVEEYEDTTPEDVRGLRIYYALLEKNQAIPDLILINTINCRDVPSKDGKVILVRTSDKKIGSTSERISINQAKKHTQRWQSRKDSTGNRTNVYAYNYSWEQIQTLAGKNEKGNVKIVYGLRTLSPDENEAEFKMPEESQRGDNKKPKFGSVVYVNVLYVGGFMGELNSGEIKSPKADDDGFLDNFSRPCPRYCDPESDLVLPSE